MLYDWVDSVLTLAGDSASGEWAYPVGRDQRVMMLYLGPVPPPGRTSDITTEWPGT